jgi:two-component system alkaline phosphatase synthesis response regulator PhoP
VTTPTTEPPIEVLVADDEPHIGRIIETKLSQGPFRVTLVYDGVEALAALEANPGIRGVVLDLMMPRLSGLDVLDRLRQDPRWRTLPCLILTAAGQDHQESEAGGGGGAPPKKKKKPPPTPDTPRHRGGFY